MKIFQLRFANPFWILVKAGLGLELLLALLPTFILQIAISFSTSLFLAESQYDLEDYLLVFTTLLAIKQQRRV